MFVDPMRATYFQQLRQHDLRPLARLLTVDLLVAAAARCSLRVVACPLNLLTLVWLALACALRPDSNFATVLTMTQRALQDCQDYARTPLGRLQRSAARPTRSSRHDPHAADLSTVSEEAFVKVRRRVPSEFWVTLLVLLTERFQAQHAAQLRHRQFRLLALDGTRLTLPDWPALRKTFGTANNAQGRHGAQARLLLLHLPLVRLPLRYELVPLAQGEPTVARRLVRAALQANDLLLLDAGYCSYGLLWDICRQQAFFLLRLPRDLNLKKLRTLGPGDTVLRWTPKDSRGQWRREGLPRSLEVRLLEYRRRGYRPLRLLTNVLQAEQLSWSEVSHLVHDEGTGRCWCAGVYAQRWQIETSLWELKVVQKLDSHLRSRTEAGIRYEVGGHLVLYLLVRWLLVEAAQAAQVPVLTLSYQAALAEVRDMTRTMLLARRRWREQTLYPRLLERLARQRVTQRLGRKYPRTKKKHGKTKQKTKRS